MGKLLIGKIVKTQGLKGEVKIYPYADYSFIQHTKHFYKQNGEELQVTSLRQSQNMFYAKFVGIDSIEQAQKLVNLELYLYREEFEVKDDEFVVSDLIGLTVLLDSGENYGEIVEINNYGATDILVISGKYGKWQVPFLADLVQSVDSNNKIIVLNKKRFEEVKVWFLTF